MKNKICFIFLIYIKNLNIKYLLLLIPFILYKLEKKKFFDFNEINYFEISKESKINIGKVFNYTDNFQSYMHYINLCKNLVILNKKKYYKNKNQFFSICIPCHNCVDYIKKAIASILNQSFQYFEIIIVNDYSNDNTQNIIKEMQSLDNRIKLINHPKNLGVYHSRAECSLFSKGKYILFLDPDDLILNEDLLRYLYIYSFQNNLDIIEFIVYHQKEGSNRLFMPKSHLLNHNHNFKKDFIYQPELKNILFYKPGTSKYSPVICRTVWNKIYKRDLLIKSIKYIGNIYYQNLIVADDTMINLINFHFANNYTNIKLPGYMYNVKKNSMSNGYIGKNHRIRQNICFFIYFKLLYKNIKDFQKDRNYLFLELKTFKKRLIEFKKLKINNYLNKIKTFLKEIKNDKYSSYKFKKFIEKLLFRIEKI